MGKFMSVKFKFLADKISTDKVAVRKIVNE